jgi:hypothetical protein
LFIRLPRDILARATPQRSAGLTRHLLLGRQSGPVVDVMALQGPVAETMPLRFGVVCAVHVQKSVPRATNARVRVVERRDGCRD